MRGLGFGCVGCGGLLALGGLLVIVAALVPGVVNSSETGTAMGIGGGVCGAAFMPILIGSLLVIFGGKKDGEAS